MKRLMLAGLAIALLVGVPACSSAPVSHQRPALAMLTSMLVSRLPFGRYPPSTTDPACPDPVLLCPTNEWVINRGEFGVLLNPWYRWLVRTGNSYDVAIDDGKGGEGKGYATLYLWPVNQRTSLADHLSEWPPDLSPPIPEFTTTSQLRWSERGHTVTVAVDKQTPPGLEALARRTSYDDDGIEMSTVIVIVRPKGSNTALIIETRAPQIGKDPNSEDQRLAATLLAGVMA